MQRIILLFLIFFFLAIESDAQSTRYVVKFKNKGGTPFTLANSSAYLSQRAIDRRTKYGIAIDSTDLPVTPSYINQVKAIANVTLLNVSKWLNSVTIQTTDANAITAINALPFVQSAAQIGAKNSGGTNKFADESITTELPAQQREQRMEADYYSYGTSSFNEIHLHNGEFLHNIGLRGQGMQIAILDGGFFNYTTLKAFDSVNANGQISGTWDFVAREASVVEDNAHGMQCLSTIAANIPGQFVGKAPKASFYLYRTEDVATEYPIEEHNWACGAEKADSSGADVISTSLGYTTFDNASFDHSYADMNGNTTMAAIAADLAAKKGILVFASVGNDGNATWHYLGSPSDADSVVAVGAVSSVGVVGNFSSYGPSSDGQIKPGVASVGVSAVVQTPSNAIGTNNGTSFACPNMAGMSTCLWQGFPEFNNMKIVNAIQQAGSIASTPDDRIGYGIPNMKLAFTNLLIDYATSAAAANACNITVSWNTKDISAMRFEIERKAPGESVYSKIADVSASAGTILANHSYQYVNTLAGVAAGTVSYRIRQVIDTATATFTAAYIDTANVTIATGCFITGTNTIDPNKTSVTVQPNPVSTNIATLVVESSAAITNMLIAVFDSKGSLVQQLSRSKGAGKASIDIPVGKLAKGKYYIRVYNAAKNIGTAKLIRL